jgi:hypothetical protein
MNTLGSPVSQSIVLRALRADGSRLGSPRPIKDFGSARMARRAFARDLFADVDRVSLLQVKVEVSAMHIVGLRSEHRRERRGPQKDLSAQGSGVKVQSCS